MANFDLSYTYSEEIIEDFIHTFSGFGAHVEQNGCKSDGSPAYSLYSPVIDCFTQGCCYWFAFILKERFQGKIVYDPVIGHFACQIGSSVYDIKGNIDKQYGPGFFNWYEWDTWELYANGEPSGARTRVIKDCILKINPELEKDE